MAQRDVRLRGRPRGAGGVSGPCRGAGGGHADHLDQPDRRWVGPARPAGRTGVRAGAPSAGPTPGPGPAPAPSPARVARFSGEAVLADPCTPFPELEKLVKEIIGPLATQPDVTLTVRVEIEASHAGPAGFSDQTIRTVSENARTLRLRKFDFEKE